MNTYTIYATKRRVIGDEFVIIFVAVGSVLAATAEDALCIAGDLGHPQPVVGPALQ